MANFIVETAYTKNPSFREKVKSIASQAKNAVEPVEGRASFTPEEQAKIRGVFWKLGNQTFNKALYQEMRDERDFLNETLDEFITPQEISEDTFKALAYILASPTSCAMQSEWEEGCERYMAKREAEEARKKAGILTLTEKRWAIVKNPQSTAKELATCAKERTVGILEALAKHPKTDEATQLVMVERADGDTVKTAIAQNTKYPKVLTALAECSNGWVLPELIQNPKCPVAVLRKLADDSRCPVRRAVGVNPRTPKAVLRKLSKDEKRSVREMVAKNPNTPVEVLESLVNDMPSIHKAVQANPNSDEAWFVKTKR